MSLFKVWLLLVTMILVTASSLFAQRYSIIPNDSIVLTGMQEDLHTLSIQQQNISADTIQLKWKKISESVPALWDASVCDNAFCNTSLVDSGMMNPVFPGDYGLILLHITPHVNYGTSVVQYAVWDILTPKQKDTLTYILTINNPTGILDAEHPDDFSVFPNPATDKINVASKSNEPFSMCIFNCQGTQVFHALCIRDNLLANIKDISPGIYFMQIQRGDQILTHRFIKN